MPDIDSILSEVERLDGEATPADRWLAETRAHVTPNDHYSCAQTPWYIGTPEDPRVRADTKLARYYRTAAPLLAAEVRALRLTAAAAVEHAERCEATVQQTQGCHISWVWEEQKQRERANDLERRLAAAEARAESAEALLESDCSGEDYLDCLREHRERFGGGK